MSFWIGASSQFSWGLQQISQQFQKSLPTSDPQLRIPWRNHFHKQATQAWLSIQTLLWGSTWLSLGQAIEIMRLVAKPKWALLQAWTSIEIEGQSFIWDVIPNHWHARLDNSLQVFAKFWFWWIYTQDYSDVPTQSDIYFTHYLIINTQRYCFNEFIFT